MKKLIALAILLLVGCANIDAVSPTTVDLDPSRGYALVSVSHSGHGWLEDLVVTYRRRGGADHRQVRIVPRNLFNDPQAGVLLRDAERRMIGELKLLSLSPGEYEFVDWQALASRGNVGLTIVETTWKPVDPPPPLVFAVSAGKLTYVGNLDISIVTPKRYRWRGVDERGRDLALFESRFAGARRLPPEVRIMEPRDGSARDFEGAATR